MAQEQMLRARELIRQKRFDEARAILKTTDHPKASDWLARLNQLDPPKTPPPPQQPPSPPPQQQSYAPPPQPAYQPPPPQQSYTPPPQQAYQPPQDQQAYQPPRQQRPPMASPAPTYPPTQQQPYTSYGQPAPAAPYTADVPPSAAYAGGSQSVSLKDRRRSGRGGGIVRTILLLLFLVIFLGGIAAVGYFVVLPQLGIPGDGGSGNSPTALARHFPDNTVFYASLRLDDNYIQQLDGIIGQIAATSPEITQAGVPTSLTSLLDTAAAEIVPEQTFATAIRPWLGDWGAAGVFNADVLLDASPENDGTAGIALIMQITDRAATNDFINNLTQGSAQTFEEGGYTVYTLGSPDMPVLLLNNQRLIITTGRGRNALLNQQTALNSVQAFNDTVAMLSADTYNALVYVATGDIISKASAAIGGTLPPETQSLFNAAGSAAGQQAVGFTILDDRSLVVDIAQNTGDTTALASNGITLTGSIDPVSADFLANVPADASLLIQGTQLRSLYDLFIANARNILALQGEDPATVDEATAQIAELVAAAGLNLEEDILGWLTGNYAIFVSYDAPSPGTPSLLTAALYPDETFPLAINPGIVIEAVDPARAKNVVEAIGTQLTDAGAPLTRETINGTDVLSVNIPVDNLSTELELLIGASDSVLVMGTRVAVTEALNGGGFNVTPGYQSAQPYLLTNPTTVWYMDANGVNLLGDAAAGAGPVDADSVTALQQQIRSLGGLLNSSSISSTGTATGDSRLRLVLTLN